MIPLQFPDVIPIIQAHLKTTLVADFPGIDVRRSIPQDNRPKFFIFVKDNGGPRVQQVHRISRVTVQVMVTFPNGSSDYDNSRNLADRAQFELLKLKNSNLKIASVTDSTTPVLIVDDAGFESHFFTIEYMVKGSPST